MFSRISAAASPEFTRAVSPCVEVALDAPPPSSSLHDFCHFDVEARLRVGTRTHSRFQCDRLDAVVDENGMGLRFVEGPGGLSDLKLVHEQLGVPLISFFQRPITTALGGLPWSIVWQVLSSRTWTKVFTDADHAEELRRFGVANVVSIAPFALHRPKESGGLEYTGRKTVSFIGDAAGATLSLATIAAPESDWIGRAAAAVLAGKSDRSFYDLYHSHYRVTPAPQQSDPVDRRTQLAGQYFRAKHFFLAHVAFQQRDRYVIFLKRRLGEQFRVFGRGWKESYGIASEPPPASADELFRMMGETTLFLGLHEPGTEMGVGSTLLSIAAAGGCLLVPASHRLGELLQKGESCGEFTDEDSLLEKAERFLEDDSRRRDMGLAARQTVLNSHLFAHRWKDVVAGIGRTNRPAPYDAPPRMDRTAELVAPQVKEPPPSLLVLLNPGRVTRHCLIDMVEAAKRLGVPVETYEIGVVWDQLQRGQAVNADEFARFLRSRNVRAVLSYTCNGLCEWPVSRTGSGRTVSFFESLDIPHLMWWTDHPQWANERFALRADLQPLLASANNHHFVKGEFAALELKSILGWKNVYGLNVGENPDRLRPAADITPDFDVVAITGAPPHLDPALIPFLNQNDPDVGAILGVIAEGVCTRLAALWSRHASGETLGALLKLGEDWTEARRREPLTASCRIFERISPAHPAASRFLRENYRAYFDAAEALWAFGKWQRTFYLRYLSRYFRVGVFGSDWSALGIAGGGWVDYDNQPAVYARGRVAINLPQAGDEEGIAHKPFQIAASGVPLAHLNRRGLSDAFAPGVEVAVFDTPGQAREIIAALLNDSDRREQLARAAHERLVREHTWPHRLVEMLTLAGLRFPGVPVTAIAIERENPLVRSDNVSEHSIRAAHIANS